LNWLKKFPLEFQKWNQKDLEKVDVLHHYFLEGTLPEKLEPGLIEDLTVETQVSYCIRIFILIY